MTRLFKTTCCVLLSSLLLMGAQATGNHHHGRNNNNNNDEEGGTHGHHHKTIVHRGHAREVRHSPFIVRNSDDLNKALAILEHESQKCGELEIRDRRHDYYGWNGWTRGEGADAKNHHGHKNNDDNDREARSRNRNRNRNRNKDDDKHGKHHEVEERELCFGHIRIVKAGTYQLEREYIFADAFKLTIDGQEGVNIRAAPNVRHLTFDDEAIFKASFLNFIEGGCDDKEGFVGGSLLFINHASGHFWHVDFTDNKAWAGGAVFAEDARRLSFFRGTFAKNHADRKGGAVVIKENEEEKKDKHHKHGNNNNNNAGLRGSRRNKNDDDEQGRGRNKNNNARANRRDDDNDKHGHKHHRRQRRVTRAKFVHTVFFENEANKGGALFNDGSHTEVEDSLFKANKAHLGGAIFNAKEGRLLVRESAFIRNVATAKGGAIFNAGTLWIVCSTFKANEAPLGADIWNSGILKCTSETIPVRIDGHGTGYCTPCTPPPTAAPTVRSTPKRKVKKVEVVERKKDHKDNDNRGGLFGGLGRNNNNNNNKHDHKHDEHEETFYDLYRHGDATAYDRWNGHGSGAWDDEEDEDWHGDYGWNAGYGSYGWAAGASQGESHKHRGEVSAWGEGQGQGSYGEQADEEHGSYWYSDGEGAQEAEGYGYHL